MIQYNREYNDEVNRLAKSLGFSYRILISQELYEQLKPNEFLAGLGIQYLDRIETILGILNGNMIEGAESPEEAIPKQKESIYFNLAKGPFIKEELVSIKPELMEDRGETVILLKAVPKEE